LTSRPRGSGNFPAKLLRPWGLKVHIDFVLGEKLRRLQKDGACGGSPRGLRDGEGDEKGRKNGSGHGVKNIS